VAGVNTTGHWCEDLRGCSECHGSGCVESVRQWFRAWWRSPVETPLQKAVNAIKRLCVLILGSGIVLLLWDGTSAIDGILAPLHQPEWTMQAEPTAEDIAHARAIVENAKTEVRALTHTEKQNTDRDDAAFTLAVAEGLSPTYEADRRNRAISPDALSRAEDIDYLALEAARHRDCDADGCEEDFSEADYDDALISYTARALAVPRERTEPPPPKGFFNRLWGSVLGVLGAIRDDIKRPSSDGSGL